MLAVMIYNGKLREKQIDTSVTILANKKRERPLIFYR
jgi:hypothetical protein